MPNTEGAQHFTPLTPKEIESSTRALVIIGGPWCPPCNEARAAGVYERFAQIAAEHGIPFGELTVSSQGELAITYYRLEQDKNAMPGDPLRIDENPIYQQLRNNYDNLRAETFDAVLAAGGLDNDLRTRGSKFEAFMEGVRAGETDLTRFLAQIGVDVAPTLVYFENGQPVACFEIPDENGQPGPRSASVTADKFMREVMTLGGESKSVLKEDAFAALRRDLPNPNSQYWNTENM